MLIDGGVFYPNIVNASGSFDVIDTSEIITSSNFFDLSRVPKWTRGGQLDTLGYAWVRCADSAGTDSIGGRLYWQGNPSPKAENMDWEAIDSVTVTAGTGTTYKQTGAWVVLTKGHNAVRFLLKNQLVPAAGKKSKCFTGLTVRYKEGK